MSYELINTAGELAAKSPARAELLNRFPTDVLSIFDTPPTETYECNMYSEYFNYKGRYLGHELSFSVGIGHSLIPWIYRVNYISTIVFTGDLNLNFMIPHTIDKKLSTLRTRLQLHARNIASELSM